MCIKLKGSGMSPGQVMAFMTKLGQASGVWGFRDGAQYNVRLESIPTTWKEYKDNTGIISVDSFWEGGKEFVRRDGKLFTIGVLYNKSSEFAVITMPSNDIVKPHHHRIPLTLEGTFPDFLKFPLWNTPPSVVPSEEMILKAA